MNEHQDFYNFVQIYIENNPECGAYVADYVAKGIDRSRVEAMQRAADMEVALTVALAKKFKKPNELILSKIEKWQGKSALNWTATIEQLRKAQEK